MGSNLLKYDAKKLSLQVLVLSRLAASHTRTGLHAVHSIFNVYTASSPVVLLDATRRDSTCRDSFLMSYLCKMPASYLRI